MTICIPIGDDENIGGKLMSKIAVQIHVNV